MKNMRYYGKLFRQEHGGHCDGIKTGLKKENK